jgi:hypothetical protein
VSKVALLQTGIFCALWWQILAELITSQKTNLIMSVERDKNAVLWNGRGRVQEVKWDESNFTNKGIFSCPVFFVLF